MKVYIVTCTSFREDGSHDVSFVDEVFSNRDAACEWAMFMAKVELESARRNEDANAYIQDYSHVGQIFINNARGAHIEAWEFWGTDVIHSHKQALSRM